MSTYEHTLLAARFATLAPEPLPGNWDDVLDRAGAARPRRRRLAPSLWRGSRRRKLVVALAIAVLVTAVATAAYGTVRILILDQGFIGLPPVGATPSAPESSDLVVQWFGFAAPVSAQPNGRDMVRAWVYADGRIIWDRRPHVPAPGRGIPEGANEFTSGYLEQRLTPEGVELVRAAVAELIDRSRTFVDEIPTEEDPWWGSHHPRFALFVPKDFGSGWGVVAVPDGDRSARLLWSSETSGSVFEGTFARPEQLSALRRVDALATEPVSVLPARAWAVREPRAYVPSHYAVCIDTSPPKDASDVVSLLPTRAAELLRDESPTRFGQDLVSNIDQQPGHMVVIGRSVTYCYKVETEKAREVADAVSALEPEWENYVLAYRVAEAVNHLNPTTIRFEPYLPDGRFTFSLPSG